MDYAELDIALAELQAKEDALRAAKEAGRIINGEYNAMKIAIQNVNTILEQGQAKGIAENGTDNATCVQYGAEPDIRREQIE